VARDAALRAAPHHEVDLSRNKYRSRREHALGADTMPVL
jgi:hypothetical protein